MAGGDRLMMVLVSDGDLMVMLLAGDGDWMVMVLVGHADRMVIVLSVLLSFIYVPCQRVFHFKSERELCCCHSFIFNVNV